jgi:hypothetical protein
VSPVKYELGFYIPEDGILHSDRHEHLKPYTVPFFIIQLVQYNNCLILVLHSNRSVCCCWQITTLSLEPARATSAQTEGTAGCVWGTVSLPLSAPPHTHTHTHTAGPVTYIHTYRHLFRHLTGFPSAPILSSLNRSFQWSAHRWQ